MRRLVVVAAAAFAVGAPIVAYAGPPPQLPMLPETPQTDDPTVVVLSAEHGPTMGSASCFMSPNANNCNGTNPWDVGCAQDQYVVRATDTPIYDQTTSPQVLIGYLELRYSPHCGTNWAHTDFTNPSYISPLIQRDTYVSGAAGRADDPGFNDEPIRYSAQIYAPTTTECANVKVTEGIILIAQQTGTCG